MAERPVRRSRKAALAYLLFLLTLLGLNCAGIGGGAQVGEQLGGFWGGVIGGWVGFGVSGWGTLGIRWAVCTRMGATRREGSSFNSSTRSERKTASSPRRTG